jgi:hypothetical protein
VGPGDPVAHGRQRRLLGRGALPRLVAIDAGTALLSIGLPFDLPTVAVAGMALVGLGVGATAVLLAGAVLMGVRARPG